MGQNELISLMTDMPTFSPLAEGLKNNPTAAALAPGHLSNLRWLCASNGCFHGCVHCNVNAHGPLRNAPFDSLQQVVDDFSKIKTHLGLPMHFGEIDVALHYDGETLMYNDKKGANAYDALGYLKKSGLFFHPERPGRNRFRIYTSGFYNTGPTSTIEDGVKQIVEEADSVLGRDPITDQPGEIVFSFMNATRYLNSDSITSRDWWTEILIRNFKILKPLHDQKRLRMSIRYLSGDDIKRNPQYESMSFKNIIFLAERVLSEAGISPDSLLSSPRTSIDKIYMQGRAKDNSIGVAPSDYAQRNYPGGADFSKTRWDGTNTECILYIDGSYKSIPSSNMSRSTGDTVWPVELFKLNYS